MEQNDSKTNHNEKYKSQGGGRRGRRKKNKRNKRRRDVWKNKEYSNVDTTARSSSTELVLDQQQQYVLSLEESSYGLVLQEIQEEEEKNGELQLLQERTNMKQNTDGEDSSDDGPVWLFLRNVPFSLSANNLANIFNHELEKAYQYRLLSSNRGPSIVCCTILKNQRKGSAKVLVSNREQASYFISKGTSGFYIDNRKIAISWDRDNKKKRHVATHKKIIVSSIQLGNFERQSNKLTFFCSHTKVFNESSAYIVLDDYEKQSPSLKLVVVHTNDSKVQVIEFQLRNLYHLQVDEDFVSGSMSLAASFRIAPLLSESESSSYSYALDQYQADDSAFIAPEYLHYKRLTSEQFFGFDLTYISGFRIIFQHEPTSLLSKINAFGKKQIHWKNPITIYAYHSRKVTLQDAIASVGNKYLRLHFRVRYFLEALLSERRMILEELDAVITKLFDWKTTTQEQLDALDQIYFDFSWKRRSKMIPLEHLKMYCEIEPVQQMGHVMEDDDVDDDYAKDYFDTGCLDLSPSRVIAKLPTYAATNRVIRQYWNHRYRFLSVRLCDEGSNMLSASAGLDSSIFERIKKLLLDGISIGGRRFYFLSYSNSQLRQHSCWIFSPTREHLSTQTIPTTLEIRTWMGDFSSIKTVARYGARLGQCFSDTRGTQNLTLEEIGCVSDVVEASHNSTLFSDGVGLISSSKAIDICRDLDEEPVSAFQIRLGGAKGVLSVWPDSILPQGKSIALRPSMIKFQSSHSTLEVCNLAQSIPTYLNRQIITLLSTLGISDDVFINKLKNNLDHLNNILVSDNHALRTLKAFGIHRPRRGKVMMQPTMATAIEFLETGMFSIRSNAFLLKMLKAFKSKCLLELKSRARIPVIKSATLIGIMDELGILKENQIFASTYFVNESDPYTAKSLVKKRVLVGRNPSLHPGDLRILEAVSCPELSHLKNVVVFPKVGKRPIPNQMSGGDLDGDLYFIIWDDDLIPQQDDPVAVYETPQISSQTPNMALKLSDPFKQNNIANFFLSDPFKQKNIANFFLSDPFKKNNIANFFQSQLDIFQALDSVTDRRIDTAPKQDCPLSQLKQDFGPKMQISADLEDKIGYKGRNVQSTETLRDAFSMEQVIQFFVDYIKNDNLGLICNAHLVEADVSALGARSEKCITLSRLASIAVDFAKTGVPAVIPLTYSFPKEYPDFMEKTDKRQYTSLKVLGKLFRMCLEDEVQTKHYEMPAHLIQKDDYNWLLTGPDVHFFIEESRQICYDYYYDLGRIMRQFQVQDEGELWSGFVCKFSRKDKRHGGDRDAQERINFVMRSVKEHYRDIFFDETTLKAWYQIQLKASAWVYASYNLDSKMCSFPYAIIHDVLCDLRLQQSGKNQEPE